MVCYAGRGLGGPAGSKSMRDSLIACSPAAQGEGASPMGELVQDLSEMMSQMGAGAEGERGDEGSVEHRLVVVDGPHEADDDDRDEDEGSESAGSSVRPQPDP